MTITPPPPPPPPLTNTMKFALAALFVQACASAPADSTMPRDVACHEQATAWCGRNGYTSEVDGCHIWYLSQECPSWGTVSESLQDACLDAIATTETPSVEPLACRRTWE